QALTLKFLGDVGHGRYELAVIFPRAVARHKLIDAATLSIDDGARRRVGALILGVGNAIVVLVGFAGERKGGVEGPLMCDVGADAQPIGDDIFVADPALQVTDKYRGGSGLGGRKPQEIPATQLDLWHEEIMVGGKRDV